MIGVNDTTGYTVNNSVNARRAMFNGPNGGTFNTFNAALALAFVQACAALPGTQAPGDSVHLGHIWTYAYPPYMSSFYNHFGPPNSCRAPNANEGKPPPMRRWGIATPTSNHPGGVNECYADGSVKFIKNSIAITTWWAF